MKRLLPPCDPDPCDPERALAPTTGGAQHTGARGSGERRETLRVDRADGLKADVCQYADFPTI